MKVFLNCRVSGERQRGLNVSVLPFTVWVTVGHRVTSRLRVPFAVRIRTAPISQG